MAQLSRRDAERWASIGRRVAAAARRLVGPEVLTPEPGDVPRALRRARRAAGALAARSPVVVRTDVVDFYGSVSPRVVLDALHRAAREDDGREAAAMLDGWGSEGYPGLPIGPTPSAVLADAVLAGADHALGPLPFLRWADDYLIAVPSERAAAEALERLDGALDRLGLARSLPKTLTCDGTGFRWLGTSFARASA